MERPTEALDPASDSRRAPKTMSFVRCDAARAAYHASRAPAWAPAPSLPGAGWASGCYACGDEEASYFIRDRRFCREHCPWLPRPRSESTENLLAQPAEAKRRRTLPRRSGEASSPTSVDQGPYRAARICLGCIAATPRLATRIFRGRRNSVI